MHWTRSQYIPWPAHDYENTDLWTYYLWIDVLARGLRPASDELRTGWFVHYEEADKEIVVNVFDDCLKTRTTLGRVTEEPSRV